MYADIQLMNRVFAADIDASAKIVLFAIIYHANKETHEAFPSWNTLMNETSLSRSTIVRAIKQLVDAGIISKHRRWNGGLIYRLERSPPVHKWCHTDTRGVTQTSGGITETPEGCHTDTGVVSHRHPNKSNNIKNITKASTSSYEEREEDRMIGMFEEFWAAYPSNCPQKMDKAACRKEYARILEESEDAETFHEELMGSLYAWKESELWQKEKGRYIRSPLSWLERCSWEDVPAPSIAKKTLRRDSTPFLQECNWELCSERCRNCTGNGCAKGVKTPPNQERNPRPPEECSHFLRLVA